MTPPLEDVFPDNETVPGLVLLELILYIDVKLIDAIEGVDNI